MQRLQALALMATSISAQELLQQYVSCNADLDQTADRWGDFVVVEDPSGAQDCETKAVTAIEAVTEFEKYHFCVDFQVNDGVKECGYYKALTADTPEEIREWSSEAVGAKKYAALFIGDTSENEALAGEALTDDQQATRDDERDTAESGSESETEEPKEDADADAASRVFGSVIAVLAAAAMIQ